MSSREEVDAGLGNVALWRLEESRLALEALHLLVAGELFAASLTIDCALMVLKAYREVPVR
jgi:uncharacterized membrane protein